MGQNTLAIWRLTHDDGWVEYINASDRQSALNRATNRAGHDIVAAEYATPDEFRAYWEAVGMYPRQPGPRESSAAHSPVNGPAWWAGWRAVHNEQDVIVRLSDVTPERGTVDRIIEEPTDLVGHDPRHLYVRMPRGKARSGYRVRYSADDVVRDVTAELAR